MHEEAHHRSIRGRLADRDRRDCPVQFQQPVGPVLDGPELVQPVEPVLDRHGQVLVDRDPVEPVVSEHDHDQPVRVVRHREQRDLRRREEGRKDKRQVKISSPTGGDQELKLADSATITKEDGSSASLDQLKEGTSVRASFDPSSNQATKLEIQSSAAGSKTDSSDMKSKSDTSSDTKSKSDSSSKKY